VGRFRYAVYTRPELAPVRGDLSALRPLRVGALRGSAGHGLLTPAGVTRVVEGKDFIDLLALLNRGIVDAVFGPEPALRRVGTQATSTGLRITALGPADEFYAVAGPGMSSDAVERVRAAYQQLVDTSVVAQLRKSHPEAWTHD
jgi:ABC-type amino acid transport substrate-binding protein